VSGAESEHREAVQWSSELVEHIRTVASYIEGRRVEEEEVLAMLRRVLRQHSIARQRKIDKIVSSLNANPP